DLHFASAPHQLPLQQGQSVAMRAWWRHWQQQEQQQDDEDTDPDPDPAAPGAPLGANSSTRSGVAAGAAAAAAPASSSAASAAPAGGWDEQVVADWEASLKVLKAEWATSGPFDGLLGFSNGAAAALLLACHATHDPSALPGLRFVISAGGYVPQPLARLVPLVLVSAEPQPTPTPPAAQQGSSAGGGGGDGAAGARLAAPLPLASLHFCSPSDAAVPYGDSLELVACFRREGCSVVEHDMGHCLPQRAAHCTAVADFVRQAMEGAGTGPPAGGRGRGGDAAAAAAGSSGGRGRGGGGGGGGTAAAADPV
ncbi:hypothetical protein TSOC_014833, partial [Tetrabaena socialis]